MSLRSRHVFVGIYVLAMCLVATRAYADPPPESGIVMRGEAPAGYSWIDFDSGLRVVIGFDFGDVCPPNEPPFDLEFLPFTAVFVPTTENRIVLHVDARQVYAQLWEVPPINPCLAAGPVAEGLADFKNAENDVLDLRDPNRATTFGGTARGTLYDTTTGKPISMQAVFRAMFNGTRVQVMSMVEVR